MKRTIRSTKKYTEFFIPKHIIEVLTYKSTNITSNYINSCICTFCTFLYFLWLTKYLFIIFSIVCWFDDIVLSLFIWDDFLSKISQYHFENVLLIFNIENFCLTLSKYLKTISLGFISFHVCNMNNSPINCL